MPDEMDGVGGGAAGAGPVCTQRLVSWHAHMPVLCLCCACAGALQDGYGLAASEVHDSSMVGWLHATVLAAVDGLHHHMH